MSKENSSTSSGVGFSGLLTIAFIVLKLCKVINWSWWWIIAPIWIPLGLAIVGFGIYFLWQILYKMPDENKRLAAGMNEYAWKQRKKSKGKTYIESKPMSKWDERVEQIKKSKLQ